ncbi:glucosaminidase domain-containing protein [Candidatus Gottesmanbacteria bacterium]|nr:glucosaminidase domain-containing protein [Candidatus Gottesmanbacteria bacterium]
MAKIPRVAIVIVAAFLLSTRCILANPAAASSASMVVENRLDIRVEKLRKFLKFYNSLLLPYSQLFVNEADEYGLDWRLVPAITGVESTFGKQIPFNSYNAYGWVNGAYYFKSWEDSIEIVSKTLKENYIDRGADTVEKIAPIYAPPSKTWAWKVAYFMEKLENFAPTSTLALELSL